MKIIDWADIDCVARIEREENSLSFEVFEIVAWGENVTQHEFERKGATESGDLTSNLDEAQTLFRGFVKWDACSHVYFGDEGGYIHLCGGRSWFTFMQALRRIWDIASTELPQDHSKDMFDLELFQNPDTPTPKE